MSVKLESVVPFGRSLDEYQKVFNLSEGDLTKRILGVGDGSASFNAEMMQRGHLVTSLDPLYRFSAEEIERQFYGVVDDIIQQVKSTPENWVWTYHQSPDDLRQNREKALKRFVEDYELGKRQGRYRIGELPHLLGIEDQSYDLALCSHFLFLYSDHFDCDFHQAAIQEMLRIATEIKVFPLLTLGRKKSVYVEPVIQMLESNGFKVGVQKVDYELQRVGNEMLWAKHL
jgi:SAM-dependent methyltransferase